MKQKLSALLISILIGITCLMLSTSNPGQSLELHLLDQWFRLRGKVSPPQDIILVVMDEDSHQQLNVPLNQGWPRELHAQLVEHLKALGIKKIVFDVLFLDKGSDAAADSHFAEALKDVPTILGIESSSQNIASAGGSYAIETLEEPYEPFLNNAAGTALVGLPSEDGTIRNFLTDRSEKTSEIPSLAEAAASLTPRDLKRPSARDLIRYYGPSRTISTFPIYKILDRQKSLPKQFFEGKTAIVGLALRSGLGPTQKDQFFSPFSSDYLYGVEVHATAAANLLEGRWIKRASFFLEETITFLVTTILSMLIINISPLIGAAVVVFCIICWASASYFLFLNDLFVPGIIPFFAVLPLTLLGSTLYYYLVTKRSSDQIRSAFELYLSPEMARQLTQEKGSIKLGGEKLWCTAFFQDIAGFTRIVEDMPAEKVAEMLNAYFTDVMEVVFRNKGTLIKFIGDAAFVLWGAPLKIQNHAELAILTSLEMQQEVERFNSTGKFPKLETCIGIHTGPMVVGNLGSMKRFDYTAVGDSVNLASRIEGLNRIFGTSILYSESSRKDAGNSIKSLRIGKVSVAGKQDITTVFTCFKPALQESVEANWLAALMAFESRKFADAKILFSQLESADPRLFKSAALYRSYCETYLNEAPPPQWHGEIVLNAK